MTGTDVPALSSTTAEPRSTMAGGTPGAPARSPLSARAFGPHLLVGELIGRGGMSRVYRGWVRGSGREVAVKVLRDELAHRPDAVQRFVRERELLQTVASPHVVRVHDLVVHGEELGIVMDLVPGGHLRRAVGFPSELGTAARLAAQIAEGLAAVHAAGVVHRDLKPENVLVEHLGDGSLRLRITDFGISRLVDAARTQTQVSGTAGYLAPEVAAGRTASAKADVYALGVLLYELCTGRQPFTADNPLLLVLAHTREDPPRPLGMPDPLWDLLAATLAKDPDARPDAATVAACLWALAPQLDGHPPCTVPPRAATPPRPLSQAPPPEDPLPAGPRTVGPDRGRRAAGPPTDLPPAGPPPPRTRREAGAELSAVRRSPAASPRGPGRTPLIAAAVLGVVVLLAGIAVIVLRPDDGTTVRPSVATATPSGPSATATPPSVQTGGAKPAPAPSTGHGSRTGGRSAATTHPPTPSQTGPAVAASPTTSPSASPGTAAPGTPVVSRVANGPQDAHSSDRTATLSVSGVTAGTGTLTSVTVSYRAPGGTGGRQPVTLGSSAPGAGPPSGATAPAAPSSYQVTITGLVNGTPYAFTAQACNSEGRCTSSAPFVFTPFGAPDVVAPTLVAAGGQVTVTVRPVIRNANTAPTACTLAVAATPADAAAPTRTVRSDGDSVTFPAQAATTYTATEICTTGGLSDGSATSAALSIP